MEANDHEIVQITSAEPMVEASVSEIAETAPGCVVARDVSEDRGQEPLHRNGKLKSVVECMLFVSPEPLSSAQIAESLQIDEADVQDALAGLEQDLACWSGLQLMRVAGGYQLCTRPEYADYCGMILQGTKRKLSRAALETLAVVAYRQPCTVPEIEAVRGVSVDGVIRTLLDRGLVREAGRKKSPGRPILYATTPEFLEYFGLNDLSELPDLDMFAVDEVRALQAQRDMLAGEQPTQE